MGYYMQQEECVFKIKAENVPFALAAIKSIEGDHFSWVGDFRPLDSFEKVMNEWRWDVYLDDKGNIVSIEFGGEKLGDDELLFTTIAPFVEPGSYIIMRGEEGALWKWKFDGKEMIETYARIVWDE